MLDFLGKLGAWSPLLIFGLATGESAAFLGFIFPGEVAVILGGVLAANGVCSLALTMVAATLGAVLGDSIGYTLGHRVGRRILDRPRFRHFKKRVDRSKDALDRHGVWALVLARFTALLRAGVPFVAGSSGMKYSRFLIGNVIGGVLWGVGCTLLGYFAGGHWHTVESWFRRGGFVLVGLIAIAGVVWWLVRRRRKHREGDGDQEGDEGDEGHEGEGGQDGDGRQERQETGAPTGS